MEEELAAPQRELKSGRDLYVTAAKLKHTQKQTQVSHVTRPPIILQDDKSHVEEGPLFR